MNGNVTGIHRICAKAGFWLAAGALIALTGCETPFERLDAGAVQTIKPGITTRAEVLKQFGTPRETLGASGRTLLLYERDFRGYRTRYGPTQLPSIVGLSILFDQNDRVIRTHYSSHNMDLYIGAGFISAGSRVSEKTAERIHPLATTRTEALAILGEPARESLSLDGQLVLDWPNYEGNSAGGRSFRLLRLVFNDADVVVLVRTIVYP